MQSKKTNKNNKKFDENLESILDDVKIHYFLEVPFFESFFSLTAGFMLGYFSNMNTEFKEVLKYTPIFLYAFSGYNNRVLVKKEKIIFEFDDDKEEILAEGKKSFTEKSLGTILGTMYASTLELLGYSIGLIAKNYFV